MGLGNKVWLKEEVATKREGADLRVEDEVPKNLRNFLSSMYFTSNISANPIACIRVNGCNAWTSLQMWGFDPEMKQPKLEGGGRPITRFDSNSN